MYKTDSFISADEIKEIVGISKSKAYSLIQELNSELKEKGYLTVTGRVSRKYFEERFYGLVEKEQEEMRWLFTKTKIVAHGTRPFYMWIGRGKDKLLQDRQCERKQRKAINWRT